MKKLLIGILWTFLYFLIIGAATIPLPYAPVRIGVENPFIDWIRLVEDFVNDKFIIESGITVIVAIVFIGFWPLWYWGLRRCLKRKWIKPRLSLSNVSKKIVIKKHQMARPPMASAPVNFTKPANYVEGKSDSEFVSESADTSMPQDASEGYASEKTDETPSFDLRGVVGQIRTIVEETDMEVFENVPLEGSQVPVVVASDELAYLLTFLTTNQEWVADEDLSPDGEAPTWFSAEGMIPSPFYQMKQAAKVLQEQENGSKVVPVVVVLNGEILNYETMRETWLEQGGYVVRYENGLPEIMMSLDTLLREKK